MRDFGKLFSRIQYVGEDSFIVTGDEVSVQFTGGKSDLKVVIYKNHDGETVKETRLSGDSLIDTLTAIACLVEKVDAGTVLGAEQSK